MQNNSHSRISPPVGQTNLREEGHQKKRSLLWISVLVSAVSIGVFAAVSLPAAIYENARSSQIALLVVLGFMLGLAVYHFIVFIYDREGAIYPVFTMQFIVFCIHLFAVGEAGQGAILPQRIASEAALNAVVIVTFVLSVALAILFSVLLLKPRRGNLDDGDKLYIAVSVFSCLLCALFMLPLPGIKDLFVPQVLPATLITLAQCLMMEAYDEHYLANRYLSVYKRQQELAAQNEALETLNTQRKDMMATFTHETRTPLAVVAGYIGLMAMEMRAEGVSEQREKDLDRISDAIQSIAELMKNYEELSQTSDVADKRKTVSVTEVASRVTKLYRYVFEQSGMTLSLDLADNLPAVYVQPIKITQILLNLLKNAARHSHGKNVTVSAVAMENGKLRMENEGTENNSQLSTLNSQLRQNHFVVLTVTDDGNGIPPELLARVFERGIKGSESGAGIGLAVCKDLIESEGGKIGIESTPGKGTTVRFSIPTETMENRT
jgi:signal transduction histidine kinase